MIDHGGREVWVNLGETHSMIPDHVDFTEGMLAGLVQACVSTSWEGSLLDVFHSYIYDLS